MSVENAETVRRMVRAFDEGDIAALVAELAPTAEWEEQPIPGIDPVYPGARGRQTVG